MAGLWGHCLTTPPPPSFRPVCMQMWAESNMGERSSQPPHLFCGIGASFSTPINKIPASPAHLAPLSFPNSLTRVRERMSECVCVIVCDVRNIKVGMGSWPATGHDFTSASHTHRGQGQSLAPLLSGSHTRSVHSASPHACSCFCSPLSLVTRE